MSFHLPVLNLTPCLFCALIQIGHCCLDTFLMPVILMSPHKIVEGEIPFSVFNYHFNNRNKEGLVCGHLKHDIVVI